MAKSNKDAKYHCYTVRIDCLKTVKVNFNALPIVIEHVCSVNEIILNEYTCIFIVYFLLLSLKSYIFVVILKNITT